MDGNELISLKQKNVAKIFYSAMMQQMKYFYIVSISTIVPKKI